MSVGQYITASLIGTLGLLFAIGFGPNSAPTLQEDSLALKREKVFSQTETEAVAVYVFDAENGKELYSKNGDIQLPLASLTKVMTAITALSIVPEYSVVDIDHDFLSAEGDSGLYANERWKLKDLLHLTLVQSSNDGAHAIASVAGAFEKGNDEFVVGRDAFIDDMNKKAKELNLTQTYFLNETGLDVNERLAGGYGSARDVSRMMAFAVKNYRDIFEATARKQLMFTSDSNLPHASRNTNIAVDEIPGLIASKTGYTDLAQGNVVVAFEIEPGHPIVVSVLGSTPQGRFDDVKKLVWATVQYFSEPATVAVANNQN